MNPYPICVYFPFASVYLFKDKTLVDIAAHHYTPPDSQSVVDHNVHMKKARAHIHEYIKTIILTKTYDSTILYHARSRAHSNSGRQSRDFGSLTLNRPFTSPSLQLVDYALIPGIM